MTQTIAPELPLAADAPAGSNPRPGRVAFVAALLLLSVAAGTFVCYATRDGMGLSPDSNVYLLAARQLRAGAGFTMPDAAGGARPITHVPPLYPLILSALPGPDLPAAARVMNVALLAGSILIVGMIFRRGARLSRAASFVGAAIFAISTDLILVHSMVWTEPLFVFLMVASLLLLGIAVDHDRRVALVAAGAAVALSLVTRYAGVGLVIGGAAALWACGRHARRRRLADVALFLGISCLPVAAWVVRNVGRTGSAANRKLAFHPPDGQQLETGRDAVALWMWPTASDDWMWTVFGVVAVLVTVACVSARNAHAEGRPPSAIARATACFAGAYLVFVLTSITFFDAYTPLDRRILAPLRVAVVIGVVAELARSSLPSSLGWRARAWSVALPVLAAGFVVAHALAAATWATEAPDRNLGYGIRGWRNADVIAYAKLLPPDAVIYSNGRHVMGLHTGHLVREIPARIDPTTLAPRTDIPRQLDRIRDHLRAARGYVVYFRSIHGRNHMAEPDLVRALNLRACFRGRDGNVYQLAGIKHPPGQGPPRMPATMPADEMGEQAAPRTLDEAATAEPPRPPQGLPARDLGKENDAPRPGIHRRQASSG